MKVFDCAEGHIYVIHSCFGRHFLLEIVTEDNRVNHRPAAPESAMTCITWQISTNFALKNTAYTHYWFVYHILNSTLYTQHLMFSPLCCSRCVYFHTCLKSLCQQTILILSSHFLRLCLHYKHTFPWYLTMYNVFTNADILPIRHVNPWTSLM